MKDVKYVESSIALSRNFHEQVNCLQGVTGYGKIANLLGTNMDYLDSFAEYVALCVSKNITKSKYEAQYGEEFFGFVKRNLVDPEVVHNNERDRRNIAFLSSMMTEAALKYGIRGVKMLAETKEKTIFFEKIFAILKSYSEESDDLVFYDNANKELKKILKSFPVDVKKKKQIWESESYDGYDKIEAFADKIDSNTKYSLSYLLYAIHAQKYGKQFENTRLLKQYYSLIGFQDSIINEIIMENRETYSIVAFDQKRYLSLARGMLKQYGNCAANLDMSALTQRAIDMSRFDPYYSDQIDMHSHSTYQPQRTISDIFFDSPETVINACKVSLSQLSLNDELKENLEKAMRSWKIDSNIVTGILNQADKYQSAIEPEEIL